MRLQDTRTPVVGQVLSFQELQRRATKPIAPAAPPAASTTVSWTVIESATRATKRFALDGGRIVKESVTQIATGRACRETASGVAFDIIKRLSTSLRDFGPNNVLVTAPPAPTGDEFQLVRKADLHTAPGAIARTADHFRRPSGPALFGMDFDADEFPPRLMECIREAGNISAALASVHPPFASAACLRRRSASGGVRRIGDSDDNGAGQHRFFIVDDGSKIEQFVSTLADRLMLAGFLWIRIAETGAMLPRTLFDVEASRGGERLFYEADAVLGEGLEYAPGARKSVLTDGDVLDISAIEPLTADERRQLDRAIADARKEVETEAAAAREAWIEKRVAAMVAKGRSEASARRALERTLESHELLEDYEIQLDNGNVVTVGEIVRDAKRFDGVTCADPFEPDYHGGTNIAVIQTGYTPYRIYSHAHGGIEYALPGELVFLEDLTGIATAADASDAAHREDDGNGPVDIFGDADPGELADLPAGALPPMLTRWVRSEARRKGVPEAFAAISALTVLGSALGADIRVQVRQRDDDWTEAANLWAVIVAPPGSAKSPIIAAAVAPLRKVDARWAEADTAKHAAWFAASKKRNKDAPPAGPEPHIRRAVVDDVTAEKAVRIYRDNPRGILQAPDELAGLLGGFGAYKGGGGADRTHFLRSFDGGNIVSDRVGSGTITARRAQLAVLAGTQPDKMRVIARDLGSDGLLQRFLPVLHDGRERRALDEEPDREAAGWFALAVDRLANAEYIMPPPVRFSADADSVMAEAMREIDVLKHIPGASDALKGHLEKWGRLLPRLALTVHVSSAFDKTGDFDPSAAIDAPTATMTVRLARLFVRHALAFYSEYFGRSGPASDAIWIAGWLLTRPDLTILNRRSIYEARRSLRGGNTSALFAAMGELENAGWCSVKERGSDGPTAWVVDQRIHDRFAEHAERERVERALIRAKIIEAGEAKKRLADGADNVSCANEAVCEGFGR